MYDEDPIGVDFMGSAIIDIAEWIKNKSFLINSPELPEP